MNKQFFFSQCIYNKSNPLFKNNNFDNSKSNFNKSQFISKIYKVWKIYGN